MKRTGVAAALIAVGLVGCSATAPPDGSAEPGSSVAPPTASESTAAGPATDLLSALARVDVRDIGYQPGYDRDCGPDDGCVFGPSWSDDTDAELGRDGCDTRNNMLALSMTGVEFKPGTNDCKVVAGVFDDPYTGAQLTITSSSEMGQIQIDHLYPLSTAWHAGAWQWPLEDRMTFAQDPDELIATIASANQSKGAKTPGEWLPPDPNYHCTYLLRYLQVAEKYDLPITIADEAAVRNAAPRC